eukprot:CAMPEP_0202108114 /NCGR_PEP_ID=MMETSP0965-20130614/19391_1 /ASSEMBLY_ACC=CAM_ASM_000507 /TAXON_ID=4773 /ORGANISM="Schizochytrium aggregatum, Strain ATCC28209" /LENGTH=62 /DNA_ID=CAMNT_0048677335 /DNA_START=34 /DNA_END=219 /DNA_ORIENTATION=-
MNELQVSESSCDSSPCRCVSSLSTSANISTPAKQTAFVRNTLTARKSAPTTEVQQSLVCVAL